ncbi:YqaA family protein [Candidatus Margulisiibacteriota bacterium]
MKSQLIRFLNYLIPLGPLGIFIHAFIESSFFPIPPDFLLIPLCLATPKMAWIYAFACTLGSTFGGMFGYAIGYYGGKRVIRRYVSQEKIDAVHHIYEKYHEWAIGAAGFTPLPYKIFTVTAGMFHIHFKKFVLVSVLSRGARFFLVAGFLYFFGEPVKEFVIKWINYISIIALALLIGGFIVFKFILKKHTKEHHLFHH